MCKKMKIIHYAGYKIKQLLTFLLWRFCSLLPVEQNRIFFSNFYGNGFADSPKYIAESLIKKRDALDLIWCVKKYDPSVPSTIRQCVYRSFRYIYYLSTSSVWVDNCRKYYFFRKKKEQLYLQTWHGFALKRLEKDVLETLNDGYEAIAKKDASNTDLMISDSRFMTGLYRRSFWYDGEILEVGLPRYSAFNGDAREARTRVYEFYHLEQDRQVILYAPTFRQDHTIDPYKLDLDALLQVFEQRFGEQFVLMVRLHPNIADLDIGITYGERIINASHYVDVQDLLVAAHSLITDYSSVMFDFAITRKPCFLYATDIKKYAHERDFNIDIRSLPFSLAEDMQQLLSNVRNYVPDLYQKKVQGFIEEYGVIVSGDSADICADRILSHIDSLSK